jgi:hypothetical protein
MEFDINRGIKKDNILQLINLVEDFRNYYCKNQVTLHTARVIQFKGDDCPTREKPLY